MMLRRGEKLLRNANIGGVPWSFVESDSKIEKELKNRQGICKPDRQIIYINREETPVEGYEHVGAHEAGHAAIFTIGGKEGLEQITGLPPDRLEALEEYIVCVLLHAQWDTFKRNGWLSMPLAPAEDSITKE